MELNTDVCVCTYVYNILCFSKGEKNECLSVWGGGQWNLKIVYYLNSKAV